jgi:DNA-binding NarL/FixJ family response regulator
MLRIAIADDHNMFRKSLSLLIDSFGGMKVVAEASNGNELLMLLPDQEVDIILLDIQMPEMDGFKTVEALKQEFTDKRIIILSHLDNIEAVTMMIDAGVDGFFTKDADPAELKNALISLSKNGFYFDHKLSGLFNMQAAHAGKPGKDTIHFTPREMEIILLSAKGFSGKEIAGKLFISLRTVEVHKTNLMAKTGSKNFISVVIYALFHNFFSLDDINS